MSTTLPNFSRVKSVAKLVLALVRAFALLGFVHAASKVDPRGEHAANLDGGVVLHVADKYGIKIKKVKLRWEYF